MDAIYVIYYVDTQKTEQLTQHQAVARWGKTEWKEIKMGYMPNIVAAKK